MRSSPILGLGLAAVVLLACGSATSSGFDGGAVGTNTGDSGFSTPFDAGGAGSGTGSGSVGGSDSGSGSGTGGGPGDAGMGLGESGAVDSTVDAPSDGDAGTGPQSKLPPFECTLPVTAPSAGSCIMLEGADDGGVGIQCNPVTNDGCDVGEACDVKGDGMMDLLGFICYPASPGAVCQACSASAECAAGLTCSNGQCARYCCTDADCGAGTCTNMADGAPLFQPVSAVLGLCTM